MVCPIGLPFHVVDDDESDGTVGGASRVAERTGDELTEREEGVAQVEMVVEGAGDGPMDASGWRWCARRGYSDEAEKEGPPTRAPVAVACATVSGDRYNESSIVLLSAKIALSLG